MNESQKILGREMTKDEMSLLMYLEDYERDMEESRQWTGGGCG